MNINYIYAKVIEVNAKSPDGIMYIRASRNNQLVGKLTNKPDGSEDSAWIAMAFPFKYYEELEYPNIGDAVRIEYHDESRIHEGKAMVFSTNDSIELLKKTVKHGSDIFYGTR